MKNITKKQLINTEKPWRKIEKKKIKFRREFLLNYTVNNWSFNQSKNIGKTSELIRKCSPKSLKEWKTFYFKNAKQNLKNKKGKRINRSRLNQIGKRIYELIKTDVKKQIDEICEKECIDYFIYLVINRTYNGYLTEKIAVNKHLAKKLKEKISEADDELDRKYNVDFVITIKNKFIGLQIKPNIKTYSTDSYYKEKNIQQKAHKEFKKKYKGNVFYVVSIDEKIYDEKNLIKEIKKEIKRVKNLT